MRNKKFIISVVLVGLVNIIAFVGWWFAYSTARNEENDVRETRQGIEAAEARLGNSRSLELLLKDIEKDKEKIEASFLTSKNIVKFIEELEFLSQKTGTNLAVRAARTPAESGTKEPSFEFRVSGSFRDLFQYLILLENIPYQISFEKVYFAKAESEGKETQNWEADFEVKLLSYIP